MLPARGTALSVRFATWPYIEYMTMAMLALRDEPVVAAAATVAEPVASVVLGAGVPAELELLASRSFLSFFPVKSLLIRRPILDMVAKSAERG